MQARVSGTLIGDQMAEDWRLEHLQTQPYLRGVKFYRKGYRAYRPGWDHDHCVACWAKFQEHGSDLEPVETLGYTTGQEYERGPGYEWVCSTCFADYKIEMGWVEG